MVILCIAAVVALLKSCGASHKLTYLVIGEALMNDGTALVLYNMLFSTVQAGSHPALTALGVFLYFLKVIFVSPLLGGAFGLASVLCLRYCAPLSISLLFSIP
jgi:NhaP-type Na+/H+ or K+/H+ antiporter